MKRQVALWLCFALAVECFAIGSVEWWKLDQVLDHQTVRLKLHSGEHVTLRLACVGSSDHREDAMVFILERLKDRRLDFYVLPASQSNQTHRLACLFIDDLPTGHRGARELVYHYPMLNEELLARGLVAFDDLLLDYDEYGLRSRMFRASRLAVRPLRVSSSNSQGRVVTSRRWHGT